MRGFSGHPLLSFWAMVSYYFSGLIPFVVGVGVVCSATAFQFGVEAARGMTSPTVIALLVVGVLVGLRSTFNIDTLHSKVSSLAVFTAVSVGCALVIFGFFMFLRHFHASMILLVLSVSYWIVALAVLSVLMAVAHKLLLFMGESLKDES